MFDNKLGYDPADPTSIADYAARLEEKTFLDIVHEKGHQKNIEGYANKYRKGGLGNLLEEIYFGYKAKIFQ